MLSPLGFATLTTNEILPKELTGPNLRRGKWTVEEERYCEKIISKFDLIQFNSIQFDRIEC